MGNSSTVNHKARLDGDRQTNEYLILSNTFVELTSNQEFLYFSQFKVLFGQLLGTKIWNSFAKEKSELNLENFITVARGVLHMSDIDLLKMMLPIEDLLIICLESVSLKIDSKVDKDGQFLNLFAAPMIMHLNDVDSVVRWKNLNAPRLLIPIQKKISSVLFKTPKFEQRLPSSFILTSVEIFLMSLCLPELPFFQNIWCLLYSSQKDGISVTKFQNYVFDYSGPTISFCELTDGSSFVIAADEFWRQSIKKFGGPNSMLLQFHPAFRVISFTEPAIFCNFKSRTEKLGITIGNELFINEQFDNLNALEVWGCENSTALDEQKQQKMIQKKCAERRGKVPLPGKWDDNTDKTIMEMAGFQFSSEKRD